MTVSPASADDVPVDACHGAIDNGLINATSWAPQGARMYGVVVQSYATQCVTVAIGMGSCGVREPDSVINGFWTVEIPPEFGVVTFGTASKIVACLGPAPDYVPYYDQEVYRVAFYTMTKAPVYDSNHYQPCGAAPALGPCDGMVVTYRLADGTPYGNGYSFPQAFGIFPGTPFKHMKISECALRSDAEETA